PDEILDTYGRLQETLLRAHLSYIGVRILVQPVHVVAALLAHRIERTTDARLKLVAVIGALGRLHEALRARHVGAGLRTARFRHHVLIPADAPHAVDRRGRALHDLDAVHRGQHGAHVTLHLQPPHAAVVHVRRHAA